MEKTRVNYFENDDAKKLEDEINKFCDDSNFHLINISYATYVNRDNNTVFFSALLAYSFDADYLERLNEAAIDRGYRD